MNTGRIVCRLLLATFAAVAPLATALPQSAPGAGYEVEKSQSVENAPAGSVGRKTTDREHRVGNAEDTLGNEYTYMLTFGGFARRCPTSAGIVTGDFEYSIVYDGMETGDDGVIRREHHARRLVAQLEGHVGDDAKLMYVQLTGAFTIERSGTDVSPTSERRPVEKRFTPGPAGEPDFPAMSAAVEMTADIAVASVILVAGTLYRTAEAEWQKINECVEFSFDPPTDTEQLGPSQSRQVRSEVRSKADGAVVPWTSDNINAIRGIGTVSPRTIEIGSTDPVTYTASTRPRRGHGIDIGATSKAGVANGFWRIVDRYEGSFTQVDKTDGTVGILSAADVQTLTANLVWTSDDAGQQAPSFGDTPSTFYRPTQGDFTIEVSNVTNNSAGGKCQTQGRHTFALSELPPSKLQYFLLEIAADGRYKLMLGMPDYPQLTFDVDAVCEFRGGRTARQRVPAMLPAVVIGIQQGTLNDEGAVIGEMTPQRRGPLTTTGNWTLKLPQP
ncbi:MAG TPA: hypothetical protein VM692_00930 [Gammaproteobacteria bacterium]|nr:hypothetical protein [Gammaproteobacteria bacterium]